ncbi:MAG: hypothetical protein ACJA0S_000391 [Rickettsiales bacterium]|jgi:hypothetical protein
MYYKISNMLNKNNKKLPSLCMLTALLFFLCGCKGWFEPLTARLDVPEGPPEYQAGWHNGCSTALSSGAFASGRFHEFTLGSGIYQHLPAYQSAWTAGWYSCVTQAGNYMSSPGMGTAPLE